jgi:hypothetical protein
MADLAGRHARVAADAERRVLEVLRSGRYVGGPVVTEAERRLATVFGYAHGVGVNSGTDALIHALMAMGIGPGDRVGVPALTFFATAEAVIRVGATPVTVDVLPDRPLVDPDALPALLGPALREGASHALDAARDAAVGTASDFDAATAFYLGVYLGDGVLQKVDRATMRVSLEARAPLLDTEVVEFCLALAPEHRVRRGVTKKIMREALRPMVPRAITERPKKGFGAPVGAWLRGPLREMLTDTLSTARLARGGWFDPAPVSRWIDEHLAGRADHRKALYTLLVLEHWRARWLEAP